MQLFGESYGQKNKILIEN